MIPKPQGHEKVIAWVVLAVLMSALLTAVSCHGSVVDKPFVNWVVTVESNWNPLARGKNGEVGLMQVKQIALDDVNKHFGWRYSLIDLLKPEIALKVGEAYLRLQEWRLVKRYKRQPSKSEVYAAFRFGLRGSLRKTKT